MFSFEINELFCEQMAQIKDTRLRIINDSAEILPTILHKLGIHEVDTVVSALPFSVFPEELARSIVQTSHDVLKSNGRFVQIHYSLKTRKLYREVLVMWVRLLSSGIFLQPLCFFVLKNKIKKAFCLEGLFN